MSFAVTRLSKELKELTKNPPGGFKVEIPNDDDIFLWNVFIAGPEDTPYEGGIFKATMKFPQDYPNNPPTLVFDSEFWHPNVYPTGDVCISILHVPDPTGQSGETDDLCWRPIQTAESVLVSVQSMLSDPNFSSPANIDASVQWRAEKAAYDARVKALATKSRAMLPPGFEIPAANPLPPPSATDNGGLDDLWDEYSDEFDEFDDDNFEDDDEDGADDSGDDSDGAEGAEDADGDAEIADSQAEDD